MNDKKELERIKDMPLWDLVLCIQTYLRANRHPAHTKKEALRKKALHCSNVLKKKVDTTEKLLNDVAKVVSSKGFCPEGARLTRG